MTHGLLHAEHDPSAMSSMIRRYLTINGTRNLLGAVVVFAAPATFSSVIFRPLRAVPLEAWSGVLLLTGLACVATAYLRRPEGARTALLVSTVLTAILAVLVTLGAVDAWVGVARVAEEAGMPWWWYFRDQAAPLIPSPLLPLVLMALTAKDALMCRQPIRDPLRSWVAHTEEA